eukprot:c6827_g1_i1.p1 GENE.c6827_g1_i1~~c6827_g1_i1.p1  ORF type:complete len:281 (+),score=86.18 c6827_g1_i1:137-979(+)
MENGVLALRFAFGVGCVRLLFWIGVFVVESQLTSVTNCFVAFGAQTIFVCVLFASILKKHTLSNHINSKAKITIAVATILLLFSFPRLSNLCSCTTTTCASTTSTSTNPQHIHLANIQLRLIDHYTYLAVMTLPLWVGLDVWNSLFAITPSLLSALLCNQVLSSFGSFPERVEEALLAVLIVAVRVHDHGETAHRLLLIGQAAHDLKTPLATFCHCIDHLKHVISTETTLTNIRIQVDDVVQDMELMTSVLWATITRTLTHCRKSQQQYQPQQYQQQQQQ